MDVSAKPSNTTYLISYLLSIPGLIRLAPPSCLGHYCEVTKVHYFGLCTEPWILLS
jgi:hypothetical protein